MQIGQLKLKHNEIKSLPWSDWIVFCLKARLQMQTMQSFIQLALAKNPMPAHPIELSPE
jgi:hypothetical protein